MRMLGTALGLFLCMHTGCVLLPRVTLSSSATMRSRDDDTRRSVNVIAAVGLGWSGRPPAHGAEAEEQRDPWSANAVPCEGAALCRWERHEREIALARVGLPLEGDAL